MVIVPQWIVALFLYGILVTIILISKPALMFCPDGTCKNFGTGIMQGNSPFAATIVFPLLAILCYITSSLFKLAFI